MDHNFHEPEALIISRSAIRGFDYLQMPNSKKTQLSPRYYQFLKIKIAEINVCGVF